jgi:hypothetical protein
MIRTFSSLIALVILLLLGGCSNLPGSHDKTDVLATLDDAYTGNSDTFPAVINLQGTPAVLYLNKSNRVALKHKNNTILVDDKARAKGGKQFSLDHDGGKVHAVWWSHESGKGLYAAVSEGAEPEFSGVSEVSPEFGVLPPYTILKGDGNGIGMLYSDERHSGYQAYVNTSNDGGKTWSRPDTRLDLPAPDGDSNALEPVGIRAGNAWIVAWVDAKRRPEAKEYRILSRRSTDFGKSWAPAQVLYSSEHYLSGLVISADGDSVTVLADQYHQGLIAALSKDAGNSWHKLPPIRGSEGSDNGILSVQMHGGNAFATWTQTLKGYKARIMFGSIDLSSLNWTNEAKRLDVKEVNGTKSTQSDIKVLSDGRLVASWVDYRNIRPAVYLSTSVDGGKNWSTPKSVEKPGEIYAARPQLQVWADSVALKYEVYPKDRTTEGKFILKKIGFDKQGIASLYETPRYSEELKKKRLIERVNTLWQSRVEGDYDTAYDVFDFAYRAASDKKVYLNSVGVINYKTYSLQSTEILGNEALVKMKLSYEIPKTLLPSGKSLEVKPVEVEAENGWVWVGNDWYMVYSPSFGQPNLHY